VVRALRGVTFTVEAGEMTAIVGPSGSGKSTLMNLIGCLDTPTAGRVLIEGQDVSEMGEEQLAAVRNSKVGFVFQTFNLLPRLNVLENVMTPLQYARVAPAERRERALASLERVGLADRLRHRPAELSGGQKQRVAIARALVTRPALILADEPTGALDTDTGRAILSLFREINAEGRTVLVVTHDPDVSGACRRIVHLRDGKLEGEPCCSRT
jgi:putative ABC transport system ATP-binding protein